jgi:WD40 repeat protein
MKKLIATIILLTGLALNVFAQQELPMFFDDELMLQTESSELVITYSPDSSKIAMRTNNHKIVIWDTATGREIKRLVGHNNYIQDIIFSPNGRQLASYALDKTIKTWDISSGELLRSFPSASASSIVYSPDGSRIAGTEARTIKIWNSANGSEIRTLSGHTRPIYSVAYSPNGKYIITASTDRTIRIWDAENGQTIKTINDEIGFDNAVYSPNGRYIAASTNDTDKGVYAIRIFNAETVQKYRTISLQFSFSNLVYSPDGRQLLVNVRDNYRNTAIKIFDPDTGRELRSFNNGDSAIAFSPDGRRILTASASFRLKLDDKDYGASYATLLDAATGRVTGTIGYGPLNVGARAYADVQIARFPADTAAVNRYEAVLQFITGRGNATRAEIEAFYRNNIRALVSQVVDEEFVKAGQDGIVLAQVYADWEKQGIVESVAERSME